jgi:phospholipase C
MRRTNRRSFLRLAAGGVATTFALFPPAIRKALAIPAAMRTGTIKDVQHIVILMQENRSFDHYFGTLRGVRGFRDRHPVPLASGKPVWYQSDGTRDVMPFHFDTSKTSALRTPMTPHTFGDAQGAWNQGKFGYWAKFKTPVSMGYFKREDIPFQFALAEAFTICDAYHCSVTTGTDANRIVFWSGSNFDPERRARGVNCTDADAEVNNLRCWVSGSLPPGYTYKGSAFKWPTIPEVLERAGISWRIYQDPNDNYMGLMHGCLAFESFRTAQPDSSIYKNGMSHCSLEQLSADVMRGTLPQVSWVLPPDIWSEHPHPSSSIQGAEFTSKVLTALTGSPEVWSRTVFFQMFDENDGLFDHVPPPAVPSYNLDGSLAGKATLDLRGHYFSDPDRKYIAATDVTSGTVRPWGLGPRVPMYVISPWSRGGWVNSQVFDHTSVARFLEKRFDIVVPAISPWHRAVCGDLTSAFDFARPNEQVFPDLPNVADSVAVVTENSKKPPPVVPARAQALFQEEGVRNSRALPYELNVHARMSADGWLSLAFVNSGTQGAVFHVYDRLRLEQIPRRYTVEAKKRLTDAWDVRAANALNYDLWVCGPNGFVREFKGTRPGAADARPEVQARYDIARKKLWLTAYNSGNKACVLTVRANAYCTEPPVEFSVLPGRKIRHSACVAESVGWYDLTVSGKEFERRFAGRMELGSHSISDPALAST